MPNRSIPDFFCCGLCDNDIYNQKKSEDYLSTLNRINDLLKKNEIKFFFDYITLFNIVHNSNLYSTNSNENIYLGVFKKNYKNIKGQEKMFDLKYLNGDLSNGIIISLKDKITNINIILSIFYYSKDYYWSRSKNIDNIDNCKNIFHKFYLKETKFNNNTYLIPDNTSLFLLDSDLY